MSKMYDVNKSFEQVLRAHLECNKALKAVVDFGPFNDEHEERLDTLSCTMDTLDESLDAMLGAVADTNKGVDSLGEQNAKLKSKVNDLQYIISSLEATLSMVTGDNYES